MNRETWWATVYGSRRVGLDWETCLRYKHVERVKDHIHSNSFNSVQSRFFGYSNLGLCFHCLYLWSSPASAHFSRLTIIHDSVNLQSKLNPFFHFKIDLVPSSSEDVLSNMTSYTLVWMFLTKLNTISKRPSNTILILNLFFFPTLKIIAHVLVQIKK